MDRKALATKPAAEKKDEERLSIIRYRTHTPTLKTKIMLQQNMITFLLEGEKTVHFAGTQVTVQPHQFVMLAAGNCLMSEKVATAQADYHSILILFDSQLLTDFFERHHALPGMQEKVAGDLPFLLFNKDPFLVSFTQSLDNMLTGDQPVYHHLQKVKLEELFLYLAIHYPGQIQQIRHMSSETNDDLIVRQAVTSHIESNVSVEELAFLCNMSLSSFKRRFARIYDNSPNKWFLEKRMERAAKMLRQENRKASEIYYELGYENLSSFIQSFKQVHGITPKQYQLSN
ncbi:helix-turn-helix domain-containing protein [Chitinophaga agri]|uniref:Helix-turn-helix transcriptional regulator n=1 Tax=Chitinophaga agri TaxID=2703787 RepID=A0A6B9ZQB2_9BACT|nr:AraC family transcriptional regulator [Chitinophaga agri]QHS63575.1 helix-turn-helix transcriptional regulator [Chitinophaga agri]